MIAKSVEITIPVLNEEAELPCKIRTVIDYLQRVYADRIDWSVVIADNGSTDNTPFLAKKMVNEHPDRVKYLRLEEKGVGRALKRSWSQTKADVVGFFDLDLATDLGHLPEALSAIFDSDYDIVYGTRLHAMSKVVGRSLRREFISRVFNYILKKYLKVSFSDGMCGFKFLKRDVLDALVNGGAESNGWFFSTELLIVAEKKGLKICELPVIWTDSGDSKVKVVPLAVQYLKAMRRLKTMQ